MSQLGPAQQLLKGTVFLLVFAGTASIAVYKSYILESSEQREHSSGLFPRGDYSDDGRERHCLGLGSQRCVSCHSLISQFSLVSHKPRNGIYPGEAKPQAETAWKPWTGFFFSPHKY